MTLDHFITIVGNEKVETLPLMTFDLGGHLRSLKVYFVLEARYGLRPFHNCCRK